jgi:uncharacterized protein
MARCRKPIRHRSASTRVLFCMLYGAGLVLLTSRIEARAQRPWPIFLRRSFWLLIFGLMHAYLLWSGDIPVTYAIGGVLVYPFRNLAPKRLLAIGLVVVGVASVLALAGGWSMQFRSAKISPTRVAACCPL